MKKKRYSIMLALFLMALQLAPGSAHATTYDHALGLTYVSGADDLADAYEKIPWLYESYTLIPIGLTYRFIINYDAGLRFDAGVGPVMYFGGAVEMWDVPVQLTVGYTFFPENKFRPYIRGGASYHFGSGDYNDDAGFGFLGAVGAEIGTRGKFSFFIEASYDTAETTFSINERGYRREEDIKINGFAVSVGVTF